MGMDVVSSDSTSGSAGWWVNSELSLPESIYSGYTTGDLADGPILDIEEDKIVLEEGNVYSQTYLRGSAPARFSWEEKTVGTEWETKSYTDSRVVPSGMISAGEITFSAEYGRKEVRSFTGYAPFRLDRS